MEITPPCDLVDLWTNVGYGFIKSHNNNVNRIMDPISAVDFRLRQDDFENQPDIELYEEFQDDKLVFFEGNESAYISICYSGENTGKVFYYDAKIADSLEEFLKKLIENDMYYIDLLV